MRADLVIQANRERVWDFWQRLDHVDGPALRALVAASMDPDIEWHGPQPINELLGVDAVLEGFLLPLRASFAGLRRDCDVFLAGESAGEQWVSACGYFSGVFIADWLEIPATGRPTLIHFGEHCRLHAGRIVESYLILDILGVIRQAGLQLLPPSRGAEGGRVLAPATGDGVILTRQDPGESRGTRDLVWAMIQSLWRYDGTNLSSMGPEHYWHPQMHWYGPTGIGSCYSLEQFNEFHEGPWVTAFPDTGLRESSGRLIGLQDGEILADGRYAALGVWDTAFSASRGPFLGMEPTNQVLTMRDFDWYRRDGRYIAQNWVPIDLIDIALQLGHDLMAEMRDHFAAAAIGHSRDVQRRRVA